jgi:hypothetical protein
MDAYTLNDYVYRSPETDWWPLWTSVPASYNVSYRNRWEFSQVSTFATFATKSTAVGMIVVYDLAPGNALGLTQRSVYTVDGKPLSARVNVPTLCLDRVNGVKVIADAKAGKTATLTLNGSFVPLTGYGFYGFLPGKYYGTDKDEVIVLATHTDAMSLTEENGAFGILGVIKYFNNIPQHQRPRTLMVYLDARHFMPGGESSWPQFDYFGESWYPEKAKDVMIILGMEHMGEMEAIETGVGGNDFQNSGRPETSFVLLRSNTPWAKKVVVKAIQDNKWPRVDVKAGAVEAGVNGGYMGGVRTPMTTSPIPNKPGIGLAGNWPGGHTQTFSQLNRFNKDLFYRQVASMTQIVGNLMVTDWINVAMEWGNLKKVLVNLGDTLFVSSTFADAQRDLLIEKYEASFEESEFGNKEEAVDILQGMKTNVATWLTGTAQTAVNTPIDALITKITASHF